MSSVNNAGRSGLERPSTITRSGEIDSFTASARNVINIGVSSTVSKRRFLRNDRNQKATKFRGVMRLYSKV